MKSTFSLGTAGVRGPGKRCMRKSVSSTAPTCTKICSVRLPYDLTILEHIRSTDCTMNGECYVQQAAEMAERLGIACAPPKRA